MLAKILKTKDEFRTEFAKGPHVQCKQVERLLLTDAMGATGCRG